MLTSAPSASSAALRANGTNLPGPPRTPDGGATIFDFVTGVVRTLGYPGLAFLTLLENVAPPIPSELIMPLAGFLTVRGDFSMVGAIVAGSAGALAGAIGWYWLGRRIGAERLRSALEGRGRWVGLTPGDVDRATAWFERHDAIAVLVGRLVPGIRTFISIPAGIAGMSFPKFLAYTLLGTVVWTAALTYAGRLLGSNYEAVSGLLDPAAWIVFGIVIAMYIYGVVRHDHRTEA